MYRNYMNPIRIMVLVAEGAERRGLVRTNLGLSQKLRHELKVMMTTFTLGL